MGRLMCLSLTNPCTFRHGSLGPRQGIFFIFVFFKIRQPFIYNGSQLVVDRSIFFLIIVGY